MKRLLNLRFFLFANSPKYLILFHIVLGGLSVFTPFFIIIWVWWCLYSLFKYNKIPYYQKISIISYIVGLEIICRMAKTSPFVPYELGKYLLIFAPLYLAKLRLEKIVAVVLLIPGIFLGVLNNIDFLLFVFNIFGWISFILFRMLTHNVKFTEFQLQRLLLLLLLGSTGALFLAFFKAPDLSDVSFSFDANSATSGGYAPNQVATVFGLGIGVLGFLLLLKSKLLNFGFLISGLLFYLYRGILTFSRGGIIIGLLSILFIFLIDSFYNKRKLGYNLFLISFLSAGLVLGIFFVNNVSDGYLFKRLTGETIGTTYGIREKDINTLTSGRVEIFQQDIELFFQYFPLGTGVHVSTILRSSNELDNIPVASHVELSRLLAEHGLLGILFFLLLLVWFLLSYYKQTRVIGKQFVVFCFVFSIGTTFHSATRTNITPLLGGLAMISVIANPRNELIKKSHNFES